MTTWLAKFFRYNNSRLITTDNVIIEKFRKVLLLLSLIAYRQAVARPMRHSQTVVIDNFDLDLKLRIDRSRTMGAALFWTGFHEFREFQFLHRYLKPEMVFIDIGANLGEYSLFAAKRLGSGKVMAFEPLASIRTVLEENVRLNGLDNITIFPFGISSRQETLTIHEFEDAHEGLATFFPGDRKSKVSVEVPLRKMDDVLSEISPGRVDFVKVDIEGGELKALEGCRETIMTYRPAFMVEINRITYGMAGYEPRDVLAFFRTLNYQPWEIQKRGVLTKCDEMPAFGNIIFMPA